MEWFEKSYRRHLLDMHIDDWNPEFLSQFEPRTYVDMLVKAEVQSAMLYVNSHVGHCYWPTKSGHAHPGFGGKDKMREVFRGCRKAGLDVIAYYSLIYNNWVYENHPDWRMIDAAGLASRERRVGEETGEDVISGGRYGLACPNSEGYRGFVAEQIREFSEYFDFDGVFFDMTFWPVVCYCDSCQKRYRAEVGREMPRVVRWADDEWRVFQKKREEWMGEFASFATAELKKRAPRASVEHQFSTATQSWVRGVTESISQASDYAGGDLYGGYRQQSFVCKLYYGMTRKQPFEYMTSRCYPDLRDHTTMKSEEMIGLHDYLTLAHHGAFLIIDAIDPRGTMNKKVYDVIGNVFHESKLYEPYMTGTLCQDVGVYFSMKSKMNPSSQQRDPLRPDTRSPHFDAAFGAANILRENHVPFGVLNDSHLDDIKAVRALVLPDVAYISDEEQTRIIEYVRAGGNLYMSGSAPSLLAKELLGLISEGRTIDNLTYMAATEAGRGLMGGADDRYPLTIFGKQTMMRGGDGNTVLAKIVLSYRDEKNLYHFASIHSSPPGITTEYPAIASGSFGKGRVIWAAAPIESAVQEPHRALFASLMLELLGNEPSLRMKAPRVVESIVFSDPNNKRDLVSLVNVQEELPLLPVRDLIVSVKTGSRRPKAVMVVPSGEPLKFTDIHGYVEWKVDELDLFKMISVSYY